MLFIENENLKISFEKEGAHLSSIIDKSSNEELLYQPINGDWIFQDVVMFPLIGKGEYSYKNQNYSFPLRHGIIRNKNFDYKKPNNSSIIFIYKSDNLDFEIFPFKFIFEITYSLFQNSLSVDVNIKSNNDIYFSYGSHTGVKTNNLASLYINSNFQYYPLDNNGLIDNSNEKSLNLNKIPLNCKFFEKFDTFVFKNIDGIIKVDNGLNHIYTYKFDAPLVAIWGSKIYNNFTCIEPWWGISNYIDESKDITNRLYINKVNGEKRFHYEITFNKK